MTRPSRVSRPSPAARPSRATRPSWASHLTRLPYMGLPPWKWKWGRPWPAPVVHRPCRTNWAFSLPGISRLPGAQPSLSGVRPPPGFTGTPMGSGEFSGPGQTPAIRQAPPLHFGGIRPLPNRTMATITSVTAPAVTMASYGGVSTSTSLGRPISSLGIAQNNQVSAPLGQTQQQWSGAIPKGYSCPTPRVLAKFPWTRPLTGSFQGASPQLWSNILLQHEVSTGTAPSALTGQRGQPADTADQPNWGMIQP